MTNVELEKVAMDSINAGRKLIASVVYQKFGTFNLLKKELEEAYKIIMEKKFVSPDDIKKFLTIIEDKLGDNPSVKVGESLIEDGIKILNKIKNNSLWKKMYEEAEHNKYVKEVLINLRRRNELLSRIAQKAYEAFEKTPIDVMDEEEMKKNFQQELMLKLNKEERDFLMQNDNLKKVINYFFDSKDYKDIIKSYISFKEAGKEKEALIRLLQRILFEENDNKELYEGKSKNFKEFAREHLKVSFISSPYDELFIEGISDYKYIHDTIERGQELQKVLKAIEAINQNKDFVVIDGKREKAIEIIENGLNLNEINKNKYFLKSALKYKVDKIPEIKELDPKEIEAIKDYQKSKYMVNSAIGAILNDKLIGGKNNNMSFLNEDGSIDEEKLKKGMIGYFTAKRKLLMCLARSINPKYTTETGYGLASNCLKEYIQDLERAIGEYQQMIEGGKYAMAFFGIAPMIQLLQTYRYIEKVRDTKKILSIEANFYQIHKMIDKISNKTELKALDRYNNLISVPQILNKKFNVGKSRRDVNALIALGIKDFSGFFDNDFNIKEHLANIDQDIVELYKKNKIDEKTAIQIWEEQKQNNAKYIFKRGLLNILLLSKENEEIDDINEILKKVDETKEMLVETKSEIEELQNQIKQESDEKRKKELYKQLAEKTAIYQTVLENGIRNIQIIKRSVDNLKLPDDLIKKEHNLRKLKEQVEMIKNKENLSKKDIDILVKYHNAVKEISSSLKDSSEYVLSEFEKLEKKVDDFLLDEKMILSEQKLDEYFKFLKDNANLPLKGINDVYQRKIHEELYKMELLYMQEKGVKEKFFEYLNKMYEAKTNMEKEEFTKKAKYYASLYTQTVDFIYQRGEKISKLKAELDSKITEINNGKVYYKEIENGEKVIKSIPLQDYKKLENLEKILKTGAFYEVVQGVNVKDIERLININRNNYDNLFFKMFGLRKDEPTNIKIKEEEINGKIYFKISSETEEWKNNKKGIFDKKDQLMDYLDPIFEQLMKEKFGETTNKKKEKQ